VQAVENSPKLLLPASSLGLFLGADILYQLLDQLIGKSLLQYGAPEIRQGIGHGLGPFMLDEDDECRTPRLKMFLQLG
jgi:hypothetical protein